MRKRIAVFDASPRHTIEILRSLSMKGIEIIALASERFAPIRFSKFTSKFYYYKEPINEKSSLQLINQINTLNCNVIIPSGIWGFYFLSKYKSYIKPKVPVVDFPIFNKAYNKRETIKICREINIPIPRTILLSSIKELDVVKEKLQFPVVIKAAEEWGSVKYANNLGEVYKYLEMIQKQFPLQVKKNTFPLIQEYINGDGYGFYALYNQGDLKAFFMHRRLREFPPTGGPSSFAESIYNTELKTLGEKILNHLNWHGVAMVEFKKDKKDGKYKLMEINPKFWGSLGLSIRSGINFPFLLYQLATKKQVRNIESYETGIKFQWSTLDLAHSLSKKNPFLYISTLLNRNINNDIYLDDPLQNIALFTKSLNIFFSKKKKYPHGKLILKEK